MRTYRFVLAALIAVPILGGTSGVLAAPAACAAPKAMTFQIDHRFDRDVKGFTEGLEVHNHDLYESTGALGGGTRLIRITPQGHATVLNNQGDRYFGEGLTFLGDRLYQLTWQDHLVFVYDKDFKLIRTMQNPHDGWGMTNDGHYLIYGDGSDHLYFVDPKDFAIKNSIQVRLGAQAVNNINELEDVGGKIYANIWMTRNIVRINAQTGCIEAVAKLDTLWDHMTPPELGYTASDSDYVLNGIAYDPATRLFTLMGKEWPMAFVGRFQDR